MFYLLFFKKLSLLNKGKEMTASFFFFPLFTQSPFSLIVISNLSSLIRNTVSVSSARKETSIAAVSIHLAFERISRE